MLSDPIVVNTGTVAAAVNVNVPRILHDGYQAEYARNDAGTTSEVSIRHTNEAKPLNGRKITRHYVGMTITVPSDVDGMPPETVQAYMIVRASATAKNEDVQKALRGTSNLWESNFARLLAKES